MAIDTLNASISPPSKGRLRTITIFLGDYEYNGVELVVLAPPWVAAQYRGAEPIVDDLSAPVENDLGLATYRDTAGWEGDLVVSGTTPLSALVTAIESLISSLDGAAVGAPFELRFKAP
jgi:hypothetical protein